MFMSENREFEINEKVYFHGKECIVRATKTISTVSTKSDPFSRVNEDRYPKDGFDYILIDLKKKDDSETLYHYHEAKKEDIRK